MTIDRTHATEIANAHASSLGLELSQDGIEERKSGFVFRVRKPNATLPVARGPIFVAKENGDVYDVPSSRTREWLDAYDTNGKPPASPTKWTYAGDGAPPGLPHPLGGQREKRKQR